MKSDTRELIKAQFQIIDRANAEIRNIAKKSIPDFHFMDHKVSNFWRCNESPIGWCVWDISEKGFHIDCCCYYCGGPVERK